MVSAIAQAPKQGDIVWLDFDPQAGHEQAGRRPALVISRQLYNQRVGRALVCPITSKLKGSPFEVPVQTASIRGVALADHIKNLDWKARRAESSGENAGPAALLRVWALVGSIVGLD